MAAKLAQNPLTIPMSQIIAADAPLLSPLSHSWDSSNLSPTTESFTYACYNLPSPPLSDNSPLLRMHNLDPEPVCMPTHQVFDFPEINRPMTPPSRSPSVAAQAALDTAAAIRDAHPAVLFGGLAAVDSNGPQSVAPTETSSSCGSKRSASPGPPVAKKRAVGERVSSKDFIPPDVSGLSKREARLVKNRAAAFLSRQRKREEFETMEIRVAELEQENKRLLALAQNGSTVLGSAAVNPISSSPAQPPSEPLSEVELLKAQLAAARERERNLSAQLVASQQTAVAVAGSASTAPAGPSIKIESLDSDSELSLASSLVSSPARSTIAVPSAHKSSASLGLMVLLCALPSLLSMRMQSPASNNFEITNPFRPSSSNPSYFMPNENEWSASTESSGSIMDLDNDFSSSGARPSTTGTKKLEFAGLDGVDDLGLGDLDISFDTAPSDNGKIRVRIHPNSGISGSASSSRQVSRSSSRQVSRGASPATEDDSSSMGGLAPPRGLDSQSSSLSGGASPLTTSSSDPFLGVTSGDDTDMDFGFGLGLGSLEGGPFALDGNYFGRYGDLGAASPVSEGSSYFSTECSTAEGAKRRVRIALKSMPQQAGEGGEWEVQIC